jgi:hypothetical protein
MSGCPFMRRTLAHEWGSKPVHKPRLPLRISPSTEFASGFASYLCRCTCFSFFPFPQGTCFPHPQTHHKHPGAPFMRGFLRMGGEARTPGAPRLASETWVRRMPTLPQSSGQQEPEGARLQPCHQHPTKEGASAPEVRLAIHKDSPNPVKPPNHPTPSFQKK